MYYELDESHFLDKNDIVESWKNRLPHMQQDGTAVFLTFRLGDSLPRSVIEDLHETYGNFKQLYPEPWSDEVKIKYQKIRDPKIESYLGKGYGSCVLREPKVRKIVSDAIEFYDGKRYDLLAYVIMPNHVHMLIIPAAGCILDKILADLKGYTSRMVNRLIGSKGKLWAKDTYDREIRNSAHYNSTIFYIRDNPRFLKSDEYTLGGRVLR